MFGLLRPSAGHQNALPSCCLFLLKSQDITDYAARLVPARLDAGLRISLRLRTLSTSNAAYLIYLAQSVCAIPKTPKAESLLGLCS